MNLNLIYVICVIGYSPLHSAIINDTTFVCPFQTALDIFEPHATALQDLGLSINQKVK